MQETLQLVLTMVALLGYGSFFTLRCRMHSALTPLVTIGIISTLLTVAGIFHLLLPAALLLNVIGWALGAYSLMRVDEKEGPAWRRLCTPGFLLFWGLTIFFLVYFAIRQPMCTDYDELSFWGTAARVTAMDNSLYTTATLGWEWQATQNPGLITWGYFVQMGGYADWKIYLAYNMLAFACFAAVLGGAENKHWKLAVPAAAMLWCAPFFFTTYNHTIYLCTVYLSAYGDIPAGLVVGGAAALWIHLRRTKGPWWALLPVLMLAANIKSNTFVLALVAAGLAAADVWLFAPAKPWHKGLPGRTGKAVAFMAAPLSVYMLWNKYVVGLVAANASAGGMGETSPDVVSVAINGIKLLLGQPVVEYYESRRAQFTTAAGDMLHQYLSSDGRMSMLGQGVIVTGFILAIFVAAIIVARPLQLQLRILVQALLSIGGFAGYWLMLALSYGFIFKPFQAESLADYNRYMYTYYIAWFLLALALLLQALQENPRLRLLSGVGVTALAVLMLVRVNGMVLPQLSVLGFADSEFADRHTQQTRAAAVSAQLPADTRLFYVSQGDNGLDWFTACYDFYPMVVDASGFSGGTFGLETLNPNDESVTAYYYHPCTVDEFAQIVADSGCTYIYLDALDDIFVESYAALFSDGLSAALNKETLLYQITDSGYSPVTMEVPQ